MGSDRCVLAADELDSAGLEFASRLAGGPTRAFAVVKELTRSSAQLASQVPTRCWPMPR